MSVILVFIVVVFGFCGWWLSQQQLMSKPWLGTGSYGEQVEVQPVRLSVEKLGLAVFLAVIGAIFALFASAYIMRMDFSDWQDAPMPRILWLSTIVLIVSSLSLHLGVAAARVNEIGWVRGALAGGMATGVAFLILQWLAWGELRASGYALSGGPASSFFYLLTGLHALHICGGLIGLGRTIVRSWASATPRRVILSVEMCAMYWHFLLFVWLAIFALLAGWAGDFIEICRRALWS